MLKFLNMQTKAPENHFLRCFHFGAEGEIRSI
nr:MAG TPA: hypothetical protein [Caudoviricetes sp.]